MLENAGLVHGTELTAEAIRKILASFDEEGWDDDTNEQMIEQARGGGDENSDENGHHRWTPMLDKNTFLRALTNDSDMYPCKKNLRSVPSRRTLKTPIVR